MRSNAFSSYLSQTAAYTFIMYIFVNCSVLRGSIEAVSDNATSADKFGWYIRRPMWVKASRERRKEESPDSTGDATPTSRSPRGSPSAGYIYKRARAREISFYPLHSFQGPDGERIGQRAVVMVVRSRV